MKDRLVRSLYKILVWGVFSVALLLVNGVFALPFFNVTYPTVNNSITIEQLRQIQVWINTTDTNNIPESINATIMISSGNVKGYFNGTGWQDKEVNVTYNTTLLYCDPTNDGTFVCTYILQQGENLTTESAIEYLQSNDVNNLSQYNITLRLWNGTAWEEFNYTGLGDAGAPGVELYIDDELKNNETLIITQHNKSNVTIRAKVVDRAPTLGGYANFIVAYENGTLIYNTTLTWKENATEDQENLTEYVLYLTPETNYTIRLSAEDYVGNKNSTRVKIVYDPLAPRIKKFNVSPAGYVDANRTNITVKWNVTDANFANVTLYVVLPNGKQVNKTYTNKTGEIKDLFGELNISRTVEGTYRVYIQACDIVGNCNKSQEYKFINDVFPPVIKYHYLVQNETNKLIVKVYARDTKSNNIAVTIELVDNKTLETVNETTTIVKNDTVINLTFTLDPYKRYSLIVKGQDLVGHFIQGVEDNEAPTINVIGTKKEYGGEEYYKDNVTVKVIDDTKVKNVTLNNNLANTIFKLNKTGKYTVNACDVFKQCAVKVFYVDTQEPKVNIKIQNNTEINGLLVVPEDLVFWVNVSDDVSPVVNITVYIDGELQHFVKVYNGANNFKVVVPLSDGTYNVEINASDIVGHKVRVWKGRIQVIEGSPVQSDVTAKVKILNVTTKGANVIVLFKIIDEDEHSTTAEVSLISPLVIYEKDVELVGFRNEIGSAVFEGLPIGEYTVKVCVEDNGEHCAMGTVTVNYTPVLEVETNVTPVVLAVNEPVRIDVLVTDEYGTKVRNAEVILNDTLRNNETRMEFTNSSGLATFVWSYPKVAEGVLKVCYAGVCKDIKVWIANEVIELHKGWNIFGITEEVDEVKVWNKVKEIYNVTNLTKLFEHRLKLIGKIEETEELNRGRAYIYYVKVDKVRLPLYYTEGYDIKTEIINLPAGWSLLTVLRNANDKLYTVFDVSVKDDLVDEYVSRIIIWNANNVKYDIRIMDNSALNTNIMVSKGDLMLVRVLKPVEVVLRTA